ncbi:MAG: glycosyltransferase, partial [Kiritimatiellae bacterium]|nr:glycosyltransferase [Kiritimatiellia bacterium]
PRSAPVDVLLLDTTGELRQFYRHADVIFIGKSLTQHGGQNILEPAAFAKPVVVGPNMENFKSIMADFLAAGAVVQIETLQGLRRAVDDLLANPDKREAMGLSAARVIREQQGALKRTLDAVLPVCTLLPDE